MFASAVLVAPIVWLILHFLYRERIEKLKDDIASLDRKLKLTESAPLPATVSNERKSDILKPPVRPARIDATSLTEQSAPGFYLRANGFEEGDDATLQKVIEALELAETTDQDCFYVQLPEASENEARITQLKLIPNRNESEKRELLDRLGSKKANELVLAKLRRTFSIVLQDKTFRESSKLEASPEYTWEVLVGLRTQLFRQIPFDDRTVLYLSTTSTERIRGDVLFTKEEFESEDTRYLNDNNSRQGILRGSAYGLEWFTPRTVRRRCLASIALLLADAETPIVPKAAYDTRTWRLSVAPVEGAG